MIMASFHSLTLLVLLSTANGCFGYPAGKTSEAFHLTCTPAHVVRHVTRNVTLRCAHDKNSASMLQEVTRIRMLKKVSQNGWTVVAELGEKEDEPRKNLNVTASARLGKDVQDTFLEITWDVASVDTFGTYMCEVWGFKKNGYFLSLELTSEVAVLEKNITASDFVDVVKHLDGDMSSANKLATSLVKKMSDIKRDVTFLGGEIGSLEQTVDSVVKELRSLEKEVGDLHGNIVHPHNLTKDDHFEPHDADLDTFTFRTFLKNFARLTYWPLGQFSLLKPPGGCPWDLTFTGKGRAYLRVPLNSTHSKIFRFCEASGAFNTRLWPDGSYCVNKLHGFNCPTGLYYGSVLLSNTDSKSYFASGLLFTPNALEFCCKNSGSLDAPITLPTHSEFMLYRRGGRCQEVLGMKVSNRVLPMDIVHSISDINAGIIPDVDINGSSLIFNVCFYSKS
ncbi:hypothetical protein RRG08_010745 [Elysia crispata]|uniref:Apextrin C-terminal domain-containing protein n=1 Tax=Elysia crispata TaxID=231223 RepID=A0AAE1AYD3_9GAST|nr:hypothetical protein RRG08_010745 [Elysia crispata]